MSVMGFKKKFGWGMGEWGEVYPNFFWNLFNFAKPLNWARDRVSSWLRYPLAEY